MNYLMFQWRNRYNYCFICFDDGVYYLDESNLNTDWFIKSQKLHLKAPNNNKQIRKFTLYCNGEHETDSVMDIQFTNYRKRMYEEAENTASFEIDFLRTYIKRLNYLNVFYFQYKLSNNDTTLKPLQLAGVSIDYKIGGEIK